MKVLSVRQPFAWLIVNGYKDVENRSQRWNYRGLFAVHTGKKWDRQPVEKIERSYGVEIPRDLPLGGIVGFAEIADCVEEHDSAYFSGPYGYIIKKARPLPFLPMRGQVGLFNAPAGIDAAIRKALRRAVPWRGIRSPENRRQSGGG